MTEKSRANERLVWTAAITAVLTSVVWAGLFNVGLLLFLWTSFGGSIPLEVEAWNRR